MRCSNFYILTTLLQYYTTTLSQREVKEKVSTHKNEAALDYMRAAFLWGLPLIRVLECLDSGASVPCWHQGLLRLVQ